MIALYTWCQKCGRTTEHKRKKDKLKCVECGKTRTEQVAKKVRNVFGARGRGF